MKLSKMFSDYIASTRVDFLNKIGWNEEDKIFVSIMVESGKESIENIDFLNEPTKNFINGCQFSAGLFCVFFGFNVYINVVGLLMLAYCMFVGLVAHKKRINELKLLCLLKKRNALIEDLESGNEGA